MTEQDEASGSQLADLTQLLLAETSFEETLDRVAELSQRTIPGCDSASVTLWREKSRRPATVVSTDALARDVDQQQYDAGQGPCLSAIRRRETYRIDSMTEDRRWPEFAAAAARRGAQSALSVPLQAGEEEIGALNLYSQSRSGFDDEAVQVSQLFAVQAGVAVGNAEHHERALVLAEQLRQALESRAVIDQAKGVVMGQLGCTADEAFQRLRQESQRQNRKLADIAADTLRGARGRPSAERKSQHAHSAL